jgi:hypothetical protein
MDRRTQLIFSSTAQRLRRCTEVMTSKLLALEIVVLLLLRIRNTTCPVT